MRIAKHAEALFVERLRNVPGVELPDKLKEAGKPGHTISASMIETRVPAAHRMLLKTPLTVADRSMLQSVLDAGVVRARAAESAALGSRSGGRGRKRTRKEGEGGGGASAGGEAEGEEGEGAGGGAGGGAGAMGGVLGYVGGMFLPATWTTYSE